MSAKILAFDPYRRIPPRHYTPIAMRGRLLEMPSRNSVASPYKAEKTLLKLRVVEAEAGAPQTSSLRW
jgi:hypothetical protein